MATTTRRPLTAQELAAPLHVDKVAAQRLLSVFNQNGEPIARIVIDAGGSLEAWEWPAGPYELEETSA